MKKLVSIICCFYGFLCFSQISYLNKKNNVELNTSVNSPIFSRSWDQEEYRVVNDKMKAKKDLIDYGFVLNCTHYTKYKRGVGLTCSFKNLNLSMPTFYTTNYYKENSSKLYDTTAIRIEAMKYRNFYLGPRFEFTTKEGFVGVGLSYDLSFGGTMSMFNNSMYAYSLNEFSSTALHTDENWTPVDYFSSDMVWKYIWGLFFQTGVKIRYPISNNIAVNSGFHCTIMANIKPKDFNENEDYSTLFNATDTFYKLQKENLFSTVLDLGLTFSF